MPILLLPNGKKIISNPKQGKYLMKTIEHSNYYRAMVSDDEWEAYKESS